MCGITAVLLAGADTANGVANGLLRSGEAATARDWALTASKCLTHRGPDWFGCWPGKFSRPASESQSRVAFGHTRLAVVKPETGAQPIVRTDEHGNTKTVLVVNGEIYNYKELLETYLKNYTDELRSDCEVIAMLYEELQDFEKVMNLIDGDFAFCLYDLQKDCIFVGRDRMGVDPLYIGHTAAGSLLFASEMKAIHRWCVQVDQVDPGAILTYNYNSAKGMWMEREKKLLPRYPTNRFCESPGEPFGDCTKEVLANVRNTLEASVKKRMMSDVPYGVLLSGGLDSSLISAIVCRHANDARDDGSHVYWPQVHSFSIGLKGAPDLIAAKKVADFVGTVHHEFVFTVQDGIDSLPDVIEHIETFDVTTVRASTAMFLLSRMIKAMGVKMVLSGEGADEIFGGYLYFHKAPSAEELHEETKRKIQLLNHYDVLRANKSTMAWGVEIRVPFLDQDFMSYCMNDWLAPWKMISGEDNTGRKRIEKHILREAFDTPDEPYIPEDVLWRQKEQFSDGVGYSWIDGLKDLAGEIVTDAEFALRERTYPFLTPESKEAFLYRRIFEERFGTASARHSVFTEASIACSTSTALEWDQEWKKNKDPSGLAMKEVHNGKK
uniref:asparagine synthase (glutamine-hydrolyzing) n=1 Tax=Rhodosorus marinus TaxID=101924 RepID=A0A7S0BLK4_9RHOD|mmetsp:Transcript_21550/g.31306  ORF Transcript_21550/g.31306 Transcript_21550/m.31306 type:complete len:609 (+) Transcript_21550:85-1911(+)